MLPKMREEREAALKFDFEACTLQQATEKLQSILETGHLVGLDPDAEAAKFVAQMIEAGWSTQKAYQCRQNAATAAFRNVTGRAGESLRPKRTRPFDPKAPSILERKKERITISVKEMLACAGAFNTVKDDTDFHRMLECLGAKSTMYKALYRDLCKKYTPTVIGRATRMALRQKKVKITKLPVGGSVVHWRHDG